MGKYKTLIVEMSEDAVVKESEVTSKLAVVTESSRHKYDLFCDIGTLLVSCPFLDL